MVPPHYLVNCKSHFMLKLFYYFFLFFSFFAPSLSVSRIMSYQRSIGGNIGSRRTQRPNSFSGTRSRNVYSSANSSPNNSYSSYTPYGSPSSWSSSSSFPSTLTTYGGTASGYGGLTIPTPNTYPLHGLSSSVHSYLNNYSTGRSSTPSSPSYVSRTPSNQFKNNSLSTSDISLLNRPLSTSSLLGSVKSVDSEGYIVIIYKIIRFFIFFINLLQLENFI